MKTSFLPLTVVLAAILYATSLAASAAEAKPGKAEKKAPADNYPLKTCVVSDEKLGDMGDPFVFKYEGKDVKLCCKSCKKDFDKDPKKFVKKLTDAEKKAEKKADKKS